MTPIQQHLPKPRHIAKAAKQLIPAIIAGAGIFVVVALVFCGIFGFGRIYHDFFPLDSSPVGPNLCASIFVIVGMAGLNEYKTVRKDEEEGKTLKVIVKDTEDEILSPVEVAEEHIADDVVDQLQGDDDATGTATPTPHNANATYDGAG